MMCIKKSMLCVALVAAASVRGEELQSVESIRAVAEGFIRTQLSTQGATAKLYVEASSIDPRLRLPACPAPAAFLPSGATVAARTTVGVRCASPLWSIYIPVSVESELNVFVLRQPALRGASLTRADVEPQLRRVPGFAASQIVDDSGLLGRHLKNNAAPGTALTTDLLVPDIVVKRGQRVMLVAATGGIEVRAQGEAIADASPSGRVRVQNIASQKIVEGQVESVDLVRVGP